MVKSRLAPLMGCESFTEGFGPLMPGFETRIALDDIAALEREISKRATWRPLSSSWCGGCNSPRTDFFIRVKSCAVGTGPSFISDEIKRG